jgi:hypothetical protein
MEPEPFDDHFMVAQPSHAVQSTSERWSNEGQLKAQAVVDLLRNKVLSQSFGKRGEYEVRTTFSSRQAWRYRCRVLHHGRLLKRAFPPLELDRTPDLRKTTAITEEMCIVLAAEAVDMHFARCTAVNEYLCMAAVFSEPPPRDARGLRIVLVASMCAALAAAYWFWKDPIHAALSSLPVQPPPHMVQWERKEAFYTYLAGKPFTFPLPALHGASKDAPVEVSLEASNGRPVWIQFTRETLRLSGMAPTTAADKTYYLAFLAEAHGSSESRVDVYLTITGPKAPLQTILGPEAPLQSQSLHPSVASSAVLPRLDSRVESRSQLGAEAISPPLNPAQERDGLLKILKGESC